MVECMRIIHQLERLDLKMPREALEEAMEKQELIVPELLVILEYLSENITEIPDYYLGHFYAIYLLAQFREKRAYPLIVKMISVRSYDVLDQAFGDFLTEALGRVLASVCDGDLTLIKKLIEDEDSNEYARCAGFDALLVLLAQDIITRQQLASYFQLLFTKLERKRSLVWGDLVMSCCNIHPAEFYDQIVQVYEEDLVDTLYIQLDDVLEDASKSQAEQMRVLKQNRRYTFIGNTIQEISWWACFQNTEVKELEL